jgi:hypothetical protein
MKDTITEFPYKMEFYYMLMGMLVHFRVVNYTLIFDEGLMKTTQWTEKIWSNGDWLLRRPRLTQGCSAQRMEDLTRGRQTLRPKYLHRQPVV